MKLQIRTLSVQERKDLYTQALEYFSKPIEMRDDRLIAGICEYLAAFFIFGDVVKKGCDYNMYIEDVVRGIDYKLWPVNLGKELMPELYRRSKKEGKESLGNYWFDNDEERLIALEDCLYDTAFLMEEEDEQGPTVYAEFEIDWEPAS